MLHKRDTLTCDALGRRSSCSKLPWLTLWTVRNRKMTPRTSVGSSKMRVMKWGWNETTDGTRKEEAWTSTERWTFPSYPFKHHSDSRFVFALLRLKNSSKGQIWTLQKNNAGCALLVHLTKPKVCRNTRTVSPAFQSHSQTARVMHKNIVGPK